MMRLVKSNCDPGVLYLALLVLHGRWAFLAGQKKFNPNTRVKHASPVMKSDVFFFCCVDHSENTWGKGEKRSRVSSALTKNTRTVAVCNKVAAPLCRECAFIRDFCFIFNIFVAGSRRIKRQSTHAMRAHYLGEGRARADATT